MKNIITLISTVFIFCLHTNAQSAYLALIEKEDFKIAEKRIKKAIQKEPYNIVINYSYALLLANKRYNEYNIYTAYNHALIALNLYRNINNEKEINKLNIIPIYNELLITSLNMICKQALEDTDSKNTIMEYDKYLIHFKNAPIDYRNKAIQNRNLVAYKLADSAHTIMSYQTFISTYPDAIQVSIAVEKRNLLAFKEAESNNTILSYQSFISSYPDAEEVSKAILKRDELMFIQVEKSGDVNEYKNFIKNYPKAIQVNDAILKVHEFAYIDAEKINTADAFKSFIEEYPNSKQYKIAYSKFEEIEFSDKTNRGDLKSYKIFYQEHPNNSKRQEALDSIFSIAIKENNISEIEFYIENTDGERKNNALQYLHKIYTDDGEKRTLESFYSKFNLDLPDDIKANDFELARLGDNLKMEYGYNENLKDSYDYYIKNAAPRERAFVALQKYIAKDISLKNWSSATEKVKFYKPYFYAKTKKLDNLLNELEKPFDETIKIQVFGPEINTKEGGEYVPVVTADGKTIYFCGHGRKDNIWGEDVYSANLKTKSTAKIIPSLSFVNSNDAPVSISTDGNKLIIFKNGKLNTSEKTLTGWDKPTPFEGIINAGTWQADAMISSDGSALLFASVRKENFDYYTEVRAVNYHSEESYPSDIYVCLKNESGEWSKAINLGPTINTIYADRSPFLHPDMKTLYFSSSGHGGLGDLDVFKSTRLDDSCWTCWSEPVNMGKEINTPQKDWSYIISTNGEKAFFAKSSSPLDNDNIYWLNLPSHLRPDLVATISGKLIDRDNKPVDAEIFWEDLETGKIIGKSKSDPVDGSYFIVLPLGKIYGYYINHSEFYPFSGNLDILNKGKSIEIVNTIELVTFKEMIEKSIAVPMNNLFFDFGKYNLLPHSIPELNRVAQIIKKENLKVEIAGHTDNTGDEIANQTLSEKRATSVKHFLLQAGCKENLLQTIGFGETKPIDTNENEMGRAKNRRVEIRFIK